MTNQVDYAVDMVIQTIALLGPNIWKKSEEYLAITLQVPKGVKAFLDEFLEVTPEKLLGDSPENFKNIVFRTLVLRGLTYSALGGGKMSEIMDIICCGIMPTKEVQNPLSEMLDKISTDELKQKDIT